MLALTPEAVLAINAILEANAMPEGSGLRISAEPGAREEETSFGLSLEEAPLTGDSVVEEGGARVFLDPDAAVLLEASLLAVHEHGDQIHFQLHPQEAA
jgi:iron-sulfur cluster assembly protein